MSSKTDKRIHLYNSLIKSIGFIMLLCICFVLPFVYERVEQDKSIETQKRAYQTSGYIYIDQEGFFSEPSFNIDKTIEIIQNVYNQMPAEVKSIIRDNWIILVSDSYPYLDPTKPSTMALGATYDKYDTIWLGPFFNENVFAHECGHAIDQYFGLLSFSNKFKSIYDEYSSIYLEFGRSSIDKHSTSSSSEFFAALFAEYIIYPEYMRETYPEIYNYFSEIIHPKWKYTIAGEILNNIKKSLRFHFN